MKDPPPQLPNADDKSKPAEKKKSTAPTYIHAGVVQPVDPKDYDKRIAAAAVEVSGEPAKPVERLTGDNYAKLYEEQREAELAEKGAAKTKAASEAAAKKRKEQEKIDAYVLRARDLQSQIAQCRQKLGQDAETNRQMQARIQQLTFDLNGIPLPWRNG